MQQIVLQNVKDENGGAPGAQTSDGTLRPALRSSRIPRDSLRGAILEPTR